MILPSKSTTTHIETHFDDTGRAEAEAYLSEIENDGAKAGEVFAEVAAKAESANSGTSELARRVKAIEERPAPKLPFAAVAGVPEGSWSKWNTSTVPGWVAVERGGECLRLPAGRYRMEVLGTSAIAYVDGKSLGQVAGVRYLPASVGVDLYASTTSAQPTIIITPLY